MIWFYNCLVDIDIWMILNRFKFNKEKMEFLVFYFWYCFLFVFVFFKIGFEVIFLLDFVWNVGVIFDNIMIMVFYINFICKSVFYYLRNIVWIRKFIFLKIIEILVYVFVNLKLDYCNFLVYGLFKYFL